MRTAGRYNRVEDPFDLDHEINKAVDETKQFINAVKEDTYTDDQFKAILKACITEMLESI